MQLKCDYCGKDIIGKYFTDPWGKNYCAIHINRVPQCNYCGRFIGKNSSRGGISYPDGRQICGICAQKAITSNSDGRRLLTKVHAELEQEGIIISPFKPEFSLISRAKLKKLDRKSGERQGYAVFNRQVDNDGNIRTFKMQIFMLEGLPEASFISTCAHELMHIWFYSHNITDTSPALAEGSCNMASYLVLRRQKSLEAEFLIRGLFADKDKIYGGGFRKVQKLADRQGVAGWLKYAKTHKRI